VAAGVEAEAPARELARIAAAAPLQELQSGGSWYSIQRVSEHDVYCTNGRRGIATPA
jgi:hypothetical protein